MSFMLLSSNHFDRVILKTSTILMIFERTVSFAKVGLTPEIIFVNLKLFIHEKKR